MRLSWLAPIVLVSLVGCANGGSRVPTDLRPRRPLDPADLGDAGPKPDASTPPSDGGSIWVEPDAGPGPDPDPGTDAGPGEPEPEPEPGTDAGPVAPPPPPPPTGCMAMDLGSELGLSLMTGTTTTSTHHFAPSCTTGTASDLPFRWTAPSAGTFTFDTLGSAYDTVLAVVDGDCTGRELACDDDSVGLQSVVRTTLAAGQEVIVVVDGYGTRAGDFVLNITSAPDTEDGLCTAGADDDRDGDADCDDIDCEADTACSTATGCEAAGPGCPGMDLGMATGMLSMGTTVDTCDQLRGGCGSTGGQELAFTWRAPAAGTYIFDTAGSAFDTVLYARDATCTGRELGCNDDIDSTAQSRITLSLTAGQTIILVVDGYNTMASGAYRLNVRSGATMETNCTNGLDDDGDTRRDCDDSDCASAPACDPPAGSDEVCYNGHDDDGDGLSDCADPDCADDWSCG